MPVVLCTIANSSEFGNGFVVSPNSSVTDGKIELCLLKPFSFWMAPTVVYRFFKRTAHKSKYSEVISKSFLVSLTLPLRECLKNVLFSPELKIIS